MHIEISKYQNQHSWKQKAGRVLWYLIWLLLYRFSPVPFHAWRRFLLRLFGAYIGKGVHPYPSAKIWAPWNLRMDDYSSLGPHVDCYTVDKIFIGEQVTVSQYSYLCTASHDISDPNMSLITAPITIGKGAWIAADVFIGLGVTIGEGAVVGARSSVYKDVDSWMVIGGNPAKPIKKRALKFTEDT